MEIVRYDSNHEDLWNSFVEQSKNSTFLHDRRYMDYHKDRFVDYSLLIFNKKGKLVALLPANIQSDVLASHGGLTYGGFITSKSMTTPTMLLVFDSVLSYLKENQVKKFIYKTIPHIYHQLPAEEDLYALFRSKAQLYRRDVLAVIFSSNKIAFQERRVRQIKQARKSNFQIVEATNFEEYWTLLYEVLFTTYGVKPVHNLGEITSLHSKFPRNIRLHLCMDKTEVLAGVVVYESALVAHIQYIAASEKGKQNGALDLLFSEILETVYKEKKFFDFGISNEKNGFYLNSGLIEQKEGFGARAVVHDYYEIDL